VSNFTESVVEEAALAWLESLGWSVRHGLEIAPGEAGAERANGIPRKFTRSTGAGALR
jgi:type I restriction enzyme, R subunit